MIHRFDVPVRTYSESNLREHWTKAHKRHTTQQAFTRYYFMKNVPDPIQLPCTVTLIRTATRPLDDDNLVSAFKWIRDELSECIIPNASKTYIDRHRRVKKLRGRVDSDPRIKWLYSQEKTLLYGFRVIIEEAESPHAALKTPLAP